MGVRIERRRTSMQRVVLFGVWKVHRDLSITFEVPYAGGRRSSLRFTATYALTERDQIAVHLNDRRGRPLGLAMTLTRRWLDDAELFLRLQRAGAENEALAGVRVRF